MIYFLGYVSNQRDLEVMRDTATVVGAMHEDEDLLDCSITASVEKFAEQFAKRDGVDICCCDTVPDRALESVREVRGKFPDMQLILITDEATSPLTYIRPGVMPTLLLFRPLDEDAVRHAMDEIIAIIMSMHKNAVEGRYVLQTKQGKYIVEYSQILYFEALDKRIYLNTLNQSYPFYSTLDKLTDTLPATFVRCHKSYIINADKINRVDFVENTVYMEGGSVIPVSRSYRAAIKDLKL